MSGRGEEAAAASSHLSWPTGVPEACVEGEMSENGIEGMKDGKVVRGSEEA